MIPLTYRKAVVESASPVGLVILLYDTLVGDIQRAIEAMKAGDIEKRCQQLNHGFQVLQQLEGGLNMKDGGETAKNLSRLYSHIRAKLLEAQFKQSVEILAKQIALVLEVRGAWQTADDAIGKARDAEASVERPTVPVYGVRLEDQAVSRWTI